VRTFGQEGIQLADLKEKITVKAVIANIDWSMDGRLICVTFKVENVVVVWNVCTA
jgi:acid phosphatase class B